MAIQTADIITKTDLIARFTSRVRDWVTANTPWISTTAVWDTNVGTVTANSTTYGGTINRIAQGTNVSPAPVISDFNLIIGAKTSTGTIVQTLKNFMTVYANAHMVTLTNTGNLTPAQYTGAVLLNGAPAATITAIQSDVDAAAVANNLAAGQIITASTLNAFIESCRNIWTNRCNTTALEDYKYNYCHSSCHSNVTCYNSRGRR